MLLHWTKRLFILLFALHLASSGMMVAELSKLPFFVAHLQEHRKTDAGLTLLGYLALHYGSSSHRHSDVEHHHLPLTAMQPSFGTAAVAPDTGMASFVAVTGPRRSLPSHYQVLVPGDYRPGLLRPPAALMV